MPKDIEDVRVFTVTEVNLYLRQLFERPLLSHIYI